MNAAARLLCDLREIGVRVALEGGEIRCRAPRGVFTPEMVHRLQAHKPAVVARLAAEDAAITWRAEAMRAWVAGGGALSDVVVRDRAAVEGDTAGRCPCCGSVLTHPDSPGRCTFCCLAASLVLRDSMIR